MKLNFNFILAVTAATAAAQTAAQTPHPAAGEHHLVRARYLMGTVCRISIEAAPGAEEAAAAAFDEIARVESILSTWRAGTELSRVNAAPIGEPVAVSRELLEVLADTVEWSERTDGAFNPLVRPLLDAWDLRGRGRLPSPVEVQNAVLRSRLDGVAIDRARGTVTRRADAAFEEGGFGKGYAL